MSTRRSSRLVATNNESKEFVKNLTAFMQENDTPMGRIPSLGYKELDLHAFFTTVDKLGGYECVTANRLWKSIFDDLSGNYISTSAATVIRKHYERFLLSYELYLKGQEFHPSILKSTIKRTKNNSSSYSEADINDNISCSTTSHSTTSTNEVPTTSAQPSTVPHSPESVNNDKESKPKSKAKPKVSSLRSVRVKSDRIKDTKLKESSQNVKSELTILQNESRVEDAIGGKTIPSCLTVELIPNPQSIRTEDCALISTPFLPHAPSLVPVSISKAPDENDNIVTHNTTASPPITGIKNVDVNKTPEPQHSNNNITNSITTSLLCTVKKRKLDILKEGGLEVTPVKHNITEVKQMKKNRSTVIQQSIGPKATMGQLSITLTTDKPKEKTKSNASPNNFLYNDGESPPKIFQSSSIYSHSERTVYGNPKDYFMPPPPPPLAPRFVNRTITQTGGEILDLTVKSPQKPIMDMNEQRRTFSKPVLDGSQRFGSNLEITLVGPNNISDSKYQMHTTSKRLNNGDLRTQRKPLQNGRKLPYTITPASPSHGYTPREQPLPPSYNGRATPIPQVTTNKSYATQSSAMSNFYTQLSLANNMMPPYVPTIDPLYLTAMQNLYPHGSPFLPIPTPEQIQFYTELMVRNSQIPRYAFPYPQDKNSSIKSVNTKTK